MNERTILTLNIISIILSLFVLFKRAFLGE